MATQKERFLKYLQTCVKSTRATESNPLLLGGNAPKDYVRFLEPDRLFDYNPRRITGRFFDPLKMAESITDSRIYGFTEIRKE